MNKLLIGLLAVLVVLVAAILIGPSFVDWNNYKALIAEEGRKATGRSLTIEGDVSLALLPAPALSATGVSLENIDGGSSPAMIELEELQVRMALLPLIQGRLQVESVSLVTPRVLLERLPDGRRNWDFRMPEEAASPAETTAAGGGGPSTGSPDGGFVVQVDSFAVENGTVVYRDAVSGQEEKLEQINAKIVAESLKGPFTVQGDAVARGLPTRFDVAAGRLIHAGATPLNVGLQLPDIGAKTQFSGSLSLHPESVELRGRLKGEGPDLAALVGALTGGAARDLPAVLASPFAVEATLSADGEEAAATDILVGLGDNSMSGEARLKLAPSTELQAKLSASRLDLDELLAVAGQGTRADQGAEQAGESVTAPSGTAGDAPTTPAESALASGFELPADLSGSVQISLDALVYRQQIVRQIRFNAAMSEGAVTLNQARALLPGGSDVTLTGALFNGEKGPRFNGRIEAASDNLRGVLDWLGVDVATVPQDRLRKMSFSGGIDAAATQISLSDVDLRFDVSRVAGGVVVALRERPGLGIGLSLDSLNVDAYLPKPTAADGGSEAEDEAGAAPDGEAAESPGAATAVETSKGPLDAFDANLNLRVGSLVLRGQTAKDLKLEGTLKDGVLTFKEASLANLLGSSLAYSGKLSGIGEEPQLDGTLRLKVTDPVRLAKLGGVENDLLARVGPFNMTANVKGGRSGLGFNTRLAALGGSFALAGTARPMAAPAAFDVTVEGKHPDIVKLVEAVAGPLQLGPGLGGLDAKARVSGTPLDIQVSGLDGKFGPATLIGGLGLDLSGAEPKPKGLDLTVKVKHGNLAQLVRAAGGPGDLKADLGGIDLKGRLDGDLQAIRISDISGSLGPVAMAGSLAANLSGPTPGLGDFNLNLRLTHPDLARLAAAAGAPGQVKAGIGGVDLSAHAFGNAARVSFDKLKGRLGPTDVQGTVSADLAGAKPMITADLTTGELPISAFLGNGGPAGAGGAAGTGGGSLSPRWSKQPIDLAGLQAVNADVKVRSSALIVDKLRFDNSQVEALLTDGLLDLRRFAGTLFGGAVQVTGQAKANGRLDAGFAVTANNVESGRLLRQMSGFDRVSGPITINADLRTAGRSEADLVAGLTGKADVGGNVTIQAKAEEAAGAAILSLLGDKVKEVRGVAATTTTLLNAFAGAPSQLSGSFLIERGVARTTDLRLDGRNASALTHGNVDLPGWLINSRTEVYRQGESGEPFLTAALSGQLDKPNVKIGGQPFKRRSTTEPATGGGTSGSSGSEERKAPSAEDLLKGLIKKLGD